jgi:hypothetical protein
MDWTASWIWHPRTARSDNFYCDARRELTLTAAPQRALARVTASSLYRLYVNGRYVGRGPNPTDPSRYYFDVHDLTPFLKVGANCIALRCYNYFETSPGGIGQNGGRGGLLFELRDGARTLLASDGSWKVIQAPEWDQAAPHNSTLYNDYKEHIDTRKAVDGWMEPGFDDGTWLAPEVVGKVGVAPWTTLVEREIPWLVGEEVRPVDVFIESASVTYAWRDDWEFYHERRLMGEEHGTPGKWVEIQKTHADFTPGLLLDFGKLVTGYPRIHVHSGKGGVMELLYGESLHLVRVDRIVLKGGPQVVGPFNRRTFRYLKLVFPEVNGRTELDRITMANDTYPVERRGAFACSDELLNRVFEVGAHTMRMSMLDHFVDCPWRERTIYGGDVYPENLISYYAFGDPRLNRKTLRQMFHLQHPEGALPPYGPYRHEGAGFYSAWSAHFGLAFLDHWRLNADRAFLDELWPNLVRLCDWTIGQIERREGLPLMGNPAKGGAFAQWSQGPKVSYLIWDNTPFHALLARSSQVALSLGKKAEAERWAAAAGRLAAAIREHLVDPVTGLAGPKHREPNHRYSQNDAGYLMWSGLTEPGRTLAVARATLSEATAPTDCPFNGFFIVEGLFDHGAGAGAVDFIRRYWGDMLRRGATTFWEHHSLDLPTHSSFTRGGSACHGWSAGPTYSLLARVIGIRPLEPGFARILVAPEPADLAWAEGTVPTPHGPARARFERTAARFRLEVELPRPGRVELPLPNEHHPRVTLDGTVVEAERVGGRASLEVPAGRHVVEATPRL